MRFVSVGTAPPSGPRRDRAFRTFLERAGEGANRSSPEAPLVGHEVASRNARDPTKSVAGGDTSTRRVRRPR
jgi:hypothetical protein